MRFTTLALVSSLLAAASLAQADVASQRLEAAAAAFKTRQGEDAAEALCEAWLAIDAVTDDSQKSSLSARAREIGSVANPAFADRLEFERDVLARIEPAIRQLLADRYPSMARRVLAESGTLMARRYATRIEEVERTLDANGKERDRHLDATFQLAWALNHGNPGGRVSALIKDYPAFDSWLIHRGELAPAAAELAASHHRLKWHRTARQFATLAIDLRLAARDRERCNRIVGECDAAFAEEKYRSHARPHMDAFRATCTIHGESRIWDFIGSVWTTPLRGNRALVLSGDSIAGDCSIEVDLGFPKSAGTIQIVLAWLDGARQQEHCAVEVRMRNGRSSPRIRFVHVAGDSNRMLAEAELLLASGWDFATVVASIEANRVAVNVVWRDVNLLAQAITADMPFERGADRATKFGFCVPEQTVETDGKRRDKDDVIHIRNLVVRRR